MRFLHAILIGSLLLPTLIPASFAASSDDKVVQIDRIIAVVDNDVITRSELDDRLKIVTKQLQQQGTPMPPQEALEKQLLERMIVDRLQLAYAGQTGLRVDDAQLDKTIDRIAEQNKLSTADFRKALEDEGIPFKKFREDIRREIILARLREREVDNRVTVSEAEVDNLLTTQQARGSEDEQVDISHILIRTPEQASPEELQKLRAKAEDVLKKLQGGADFAQISAGFSDAPNALEGGKLGWKKLSELPDLFQDPLKKLKAGEITQILRSPNGFHILKINDKRGDSGPMVVQQTHARHILVKPSEVLSDAEAQRRLTDLKERLENGGNFEELARQYSEDGTASKGGDLGWLNPGDTVPEFEKAMDALQPGQVSDPVRSPFGWHLIQVIERRSQDMSKDSARLKARQEIKARKADEAYQDWIRELRDRAYVEYRLEDKD
ncbi:peptidyl-prolyl cis-trans isomerase SurA [Novimethylophilus kurashikiensis]|uniref:Chaperone SurA n=1 Tax=Novimethylophilus kurashikiensis TaxID=1825523 RepID=A0A2R5FBH6_9PROT|nr:peptidylprolyl isomerase [Novimethylophilus kurashikiensis]GBG15600.1 peptidyl-prolyl cis-trans isomerase SurA [Novimethylophilus kurashikiensis]